MHKHPCGRTFSNGWGKKMMQYLSLPLIPNQMMKSVTCVCARENPRDMMSARGINSNISIIIRIRVNESTHTIFICNQPPLSNLLYIQKKIIHINR